MTRNASSPQQRHFLTLLPRQWSICDWEWFCRLVSPVFNDFGECGCAEGGRPDDLHAYDIESGSWTEFSTLGTFASFEGATGLAASNGKLYACSVSHDSTGIVLHEYNITSGTWKDLSPRREPLSRQGMGFIESNGKLYVFAGSGDSAPYNSVPD
eukprot:2502781-Rhodomonas_salina.3